LIWLQAEAERLRREAAANSQKNQRIEEPGAFVELLPSAADVSATGMDGHP